MKPFSVFSILYMTAFLMEMTERWKYPGFTLAFLALITFMIATGINRFKFLVFLVITTAYFLVFQFPEVANHVNLILLCNLALISCMVYAYLRSRQYPTAADYYEMILPVLRIALILVYVLAGFHKLNDDFFNPEVSCAGGLLLAGILPMLKSTILGIPTALILLMSSLYLAWRLMGNPFQSIAPPRKPALMLALIAAVTILGMAMATGWSETIAASGLGLNLKAIVVLSTAGGVVLWEVVGGLLLIFPRLQAPILLFSWAMHSVLALIGCVDFGAFAFALLFTFIPNHYFQILQEHSSLTVFKIKINRLHTYYGLNVIGGIVAGLYVALFPVSESIKAVAGLFLIGSALLLMWPILTVIGSPTSRSPWGGVPILNHRIPKLFWGFLVIALLGYGMTSYLGLRTAGNFSMFSNLRTEGETSNHWLLRTNPLKLWGYQEDVVWFVNIDDEAAELGHKYVPLQDQGLPVVEFRKLIYKWTQAGYSVPLVFEYQGQRYETADIVQDPRWRTDRRDWEMIFMDFRAIQPDGPNQCRW
jgi:hypothetical protein